MSFYFPNVDPTYLYKRQSDEYVRLSQNLKIRQNRIILREVPNYGNRVSIKTSTGGNLTEVGINATSLTPTEYKVDYTQGVVYFHENLEEDFVTAEYTGTGYVNIPAERVLLDRGILSDEETLQQFIDRAQDILSDSLEAITNSSEATNAAIQATQQALRAVQDAKDFLDSTIKINKPLVQTYEELLTTYPEPENGWTVFVHSEGIRYRWDGFNNEWVAIDSVGGEFPLASETLDGMMSKEDFNKLKNIDDNIQSRVATFILPQQVLVGVQQPHIVFPYSGIIEEISVSVAKSDDSLTQVNVEKSTNYEDWENVTEEPINIQPNSNFDDGSYIVANPIVNKGDVFRLNIPIVSNVSNLTLNMKVKI